MSTTGGGAVSALHPDNAKLTVVSTDDGLWQSYLSDNSQAADGEGGHAGAPGARA